MPTASERDRPVDILLATLTVTLVALVHCDEPEDLLLIHAGRGLHHTEGKMVQTSSLPDHLSSFEGIDRV
jgi:hypothetical protein